MGSEFQDEYERITEAIDKQKQKLFEITAKAE